ncbi:PREDICTED: protein unc-93 homolog A-like [Priapulus caudatus]|uniref:Protein unc-93 homolog A-like n=1 Tax=Priapulus caudatus TaxID=37621 RepID=A0ABM1DYC5_PRICU|nr:PREDICTED: protein unc-93 homolog A-like [Priapulus caudatus]
MSNQKLSTLERVYPPRRYSVIEIATPGGGMSHCGSDSRKSSNCSGDGRRLSVLDALHGAPHRISNAADLHYPPKRRPSSIDHVIRLSPRRASAVQRTSLIESIEESPQSSPRSSTCGSGSNRVSVRLDGRLQVPTAHDFQSIDLHLDLGDLKRGRSLSCYGAYLPHKITVTGDTIQIHQREPDGGGGGKQQRSSWSQQLRQMKNLIVLAVAYMLVFVGFSGLRSLQSVLALTDRGDVGLLSLCTLYATMCLTGVFSSALTNRLTPKWTVVIAFVLYSVYFAANLHPRLYTLVPASVLAGAMSGPLWNAQTLYLYATSRKYAFLTEELTERILNRFNRLFGAIFHCSAIVGNAVALVVYRSSRRLRAPVAGAEPTNGTWAGAWEEERNTTSCSAQACVARNATAAASGGGGTYVVQYAGQQLDSCLLLTSVYIGCGLLGVALSTALLDRLEPSMRESPSRKSCVRLTLRMLKALQDGRVLCLALLIVFTGMEQAFIFADFTRAYVFCTLAITDVSQTMICYGMTAVVSVVTISHVTKHINRLAILGAGLVFQMCLLMVLWLWKPARDDQPVFYVLAAGWALCDVIWNSQIYNLIALLMGDMYEYAYNALYMLQALGMAIAFGYSSYLCEELKIYMMTGMLGAGLFFYSIIELRIQKLKRDYVTTF